MRMHRINIEVKIFSAQLYKFLKQYAEHKDRETLASHSKEENSNEKDIDSPSSPNYNATGPVSS